MRRQTSNERPTFTFHVSLFTSHSIGIRSPLYLCLHASKWWSTDKMVEPGSKTCWPVWKETRYRDHSFFDRHAGDRLYQRKDHQRTKAGSYACCSMYLVLPKRLLWSRRKRQGWLAAFSPAQNFARNEYDRTGELFEGSYIAILSKPRFLNQDLMI